MIELDNSIMNADELMNRIRIKILNKGINMEDHYKEIKKIKNQENVMRDTEYLMLLESLRHNCNILDTTWFYEGISVNSPNLIKVFFKRLIRKSHHWFLNPYWEQQNSFNGAVTRAIKDLLKIQVELINKLEEK